METSEISCVGFIMDGNRRWAKSRNLQQLEGHKKGVEVLENVIRWTRDRNIPHAVFYAFSSENWNRKEDEVNYLMDLFSTYILKLHKKLSDTNDDEEKVRIIFIGDRERFSRTLRQNMAKVEEESAAYTNTTVWIAVSYGGRAEIIDAINKTKASTHIVTEESLREQMWSKDMPDPDLIIRTGGQQRLSNFLLWQSAYSELMFIDTLWPDISPSELDACIEMYRARIRNFGV